MAKRKSLEQACDELLDGIPGVMKNVTVTLNGECSPSEPLADGPGVEHKSATNGERPTFTTAKNCAEVIEATVDEIARYMPSIAEAETRHSTAAEEAKNAKRGLEAAHAHLAMLCKRLADAKNGIYQPVLPFPSVNGKPADPSAELPIDALVQYGITDKAAESLESQECPTIGALEKLMREDELWHRKLEGFGEAKVNKLIDALLAFRKEHPIPEAAEPATTETK